MSFRIDRREGLPPEGPLSAETRERGDLDFKGYADPRILWEHAKDVAAFANALGGVILVGAAEDRATGHVAYLGVQGQSAKDVQSIYEDAARACSPPCVVDPVAVPIDAARVLVAVNVVPAVDAVVAAPVGTHDRNGVPGKHPLGWFFPRRVGSQTQPIPPAELPMHMNVNARRGFLLINRIPIASRLQITVFYASWRQGSMYGGMAIEYKDRELDLKGVIAESNVVEFVARAGQQEPVRVPLMDVQDAWERTAGKWAVRVAGMIGEGPPNQFGPQLRYIPMWR